MRVLFIAAKGRTACYASNNEQNRLVMDNYNRQNGNPSPVAEKKPRRALDLMAVKIVLVIAAIWALLIFLNMFFHFIAWGLQWFFWGALTVAVLACIVPCRQNKYQNTARAFLAGVIALAVILLLIKIF